MRRLDSGLPTFETARLRLRGLRYGDEAFLAMLDSSPAVMRYIHSGPLTCSQAGRFAALQVEIDMSPCVWKRSGKWIVELRDRPVRIGWVETSKLRIGLEDLTNLRI